MTPQDHIRETTRRQAMAADPFGSRWVSANAGTGKTHVLVQRVLRLLLEGAKAETILCLTYTNAAAAEMENRLFQRLADWAVMDDAGLEKTLTRLLGTAPDADRLRLARTLFASTLETAGGLKVQTIHSFCERLLRRFPLEADIAPNSTLLDDLASREMKQAAIEKVLRRAVKRPDSRLGRALTTVVALTSEDGFNDLIDEALSKRDLIRAINADNTDEKDPFGTAIARLQREFGLSPDDSEASLRAELAGCISDSEIEAVYEVLNAATGNALKTAESLMQARHATGERERIEALRGAFMTDKNQPKKSLAAKNVFEAAPLQMQGLVEAQDRFATLWARQRALRVVRASDALLRLASEVLQAYTDAKVTRAQLDFDDLIEKTNFLLGKADGASWVLFKLDNGLDHILVDEAQDTSPDQWRLISRLSEEFFAGKGTHENQSIERTVFAVGDEKQSIYSFQGAEPKLFARMRAKMERQAKNIGHELPLIPLTLSFRSTSAVLDAVDAVFADKVRVPGLTFNDAPIKHGAVRMGEHGLVEIWDVERADVETDKASAFDPLSDLTKSADPKERLADRIALTIRRWLDANTVLPSTGKPIEPGDILILVKKRQPFTPLMIRALRRYDIPVAGADRMRINEQIAIEDLMALGDFLLLPEDDLALAEVLKSPLFALTDDDLFRIRRDPVDTDLVTLDENGAERVKRIPLWWALKKARDKEKDPRYGEAYDQLARWMMRADKVPPYELFAGILDINGAREKLTARLGSEAGDAINEFLAMALAFDEASPPSLQSFLDQMRRARAEIKRDLEKGVNEVRIMTVHGAKGLEAEIVFMPDTTNMRANNRSGKVQTLACSGADEATPEHLIWCVSGSDDVPAVSDIKEAKKAAELEEYNRLLYVAMTRARDRLYVCGWLGARQKLADNCWYSLINAGLDGIAHQTTDEEGRTLRRFEAGSTDAGKKAAAGEMQAAAGQISAPAWMETDAPGEKAVLAETLTPSKLVPADLADSVKESLPDQAIGGEAERLARDMGKLRGILVHSLLEHLPSLPASLRFDAAARVIEANGADLAPETQEAIVSEAIGVLEHSEFASLFTTESSAETSFNAALPMQANEGKPIRVSGQIDRLVVTDREVLIIDYKTNRDVPARAEDAPLAYVAQLAAYRLAIRPLFPGKAIRCALLWTAAPILMWLPDAALDAFEAELPRLAKA